MIVHNTPPFGIQRGSGFPEPDPHGVSTLNPGRFGGGVGAGAGAAGVLQSD